MSPLSGLHIIIHHEDRCVAMMTETVTVSKALDCNSVLTQLPEKTPLHE
jgi:hypothetical protein